MTALDFSADTGLLAVFPGTTNICLGRLIAVRYSPWRLWPHRRINIFVVHNWTAYLLITSVLIHPLILLFSTNSRWHLLDVALPVRSPVQPIENTIGAVSVYLNRGSPTHLIFSASARRNPIDPLNGEKAFVESCFFVVLLTTVWAWRYRLRKDRKEERSETSLWRRLVSALLPAGDQVPAVSEPALPAGGPPQPRRPDRGALVGRGGLSIGEIRRGLNAERLSGRTLVDRSVA
jgi:hypothetical protein